MEHTLSSLKGMLLNDVRDSSFAVSVAKEYSSEHRNSEMV
jgi:hypothetical protein